MFDSKDETKPVQIKSRLPGDKILRIKKPRIISLKRAMGVLGIFSTAYGNLGSSIYYALGVTAMYALGATPIVFALAGLLFICTAMTYAEGTAAIPEAGGSSSFARKAFNELVSFFAAWCLILGYIVTISISAFTAVGYLASAFSKFNYVGPLFTLLKTFPGNIYATAVILVFLMVLNVRGIKESAFFNVFWAVIDVVTQVFLLVLGVLFLFNLPTLINQIHWGVAPTWKNLLISFSVVMVSFTGIETISNMAEEAKDPEKTIPKSIWWTVTVAIFMFLGLASIGLSCMPVKLVNGEYTTILVTQYINDPVAGIAAHLPILRDFMHAWVGILAATILIIATNAGILGISRLCFSMGSHNQIPPILGKLHKRYKTPYVAIILFTIIAIFIIIPADLTKLADAYVFGTMLSYTIAHASIIALRIKFPDMKRPYKMPFNIKIKGKDIPILPIIGGIWTLAVWFVVTVTNYYGRLVGIPFLIAGFILYIAYRKSQNLSLTQTVTKKQGRA
ncbi:MAG: APC family permease [Armatimonadota bacterium]